MSLKDEGTIAANSTFSKVDDLAIFKKNVQQLSEEEEDEDNKRVFDLPRRVLLLPLPSHLEHLMQLFAQFDTNLRLHRQRHDTWTCSLDTLSEMIDKSFKRSFEEKHFQQFQTIVPGFFIHKWEVRKSHIKLMIEIPADATAQVDNHNLAHEKK